MFGVSADMAEALIPEDEEAFAVWIENWSAVRLFLALATQWRTAGMAGLRVGLDYAAVGAVAAWTGVTVTPALFADLQVLEAGALEVFAETVRHDRS